MVTARAAPVAPRLYPRGHGARPRHESNLVLSDQKSPKHSLNTVYQGWTLAVL